MKTSICLPSVGEKTLVEPRCSTEVSIMVCTSMLDVRELKLMNSGTFLLASSELMKLRIVTVLAVPDSPTKISGLRISIILRRKYVYRTVSTVGTKICPRRTTLSVEQTNEREPTLVNSKGTGGVYLLGSQRSHLGGSIVRSKLYS